MQNDKISVSEDWKDLIYILITVFDWFEIWTEDYLLLYYRVYVQYKSFILQCTL